MKINIKKIIKDEERLTMYAKIPMFKTFREYAMILNNYFKDNDNFLDIGIDETGKYVILDFVLRSKKDIYKANMRIGMKKI